MSEFDKKIGDVLKSEAGALPESYEKKLRDVLQQLPEDTGRVHRGVCVMYYVAKAACVVLLVLAFYVTPQVVAGVQSYIGRLNDMNNAELSQIHDGTQNSFGEAEKYSRELFDSEKKRIRELRKEYRAGTSYPQKEIRRVRKESERVSEDFCFCYEKNIYYLPKNRMSEEQMRQIVDFQYRREYALQHSQEEAESFHGGSSDEEKVVQIDEDKVKRRSREILYDLYKCDVSQAECSLQAENGEACVSYQSSDWNYDIEVRLSPEEMKVLVVSFLDKREETTDQKIPVEEKEYCNYGTEIWRMAEKLNLSDKSSRLLMRYRFTEENVLALGGVTYYLEMSDGSGYQFSYHAGKKTVCQIAYLSDIQEWLETEKGQEADLKKEGTYQKWITIENE